MENFHDFNDYLDCVPSVCPSGYEDYGIDCSLSTRCKRTCANIGCGSWSLIHDSNRQWSDFNLGRDVIGIRIWKYSDFETNKCYKVETYSDNNIIRSSDIDYEDDGETDSATALYWTMKNKNTYQPWGGDCDADSLGDLLDRRDHYLIDDYDNGNDYDSADNLGGSWTGYCMPSNIGCSGYTRCTTECIGDEWELNFIAIPNMINDYESLDPDDSKGACNADDIWTSSAANDYIRFNSDDYIRNRVWKANLVTTNTNNQYCDKTPLKTTYFNYRDGYYDTSSKEFRGFGEVIETLPDNTQITHRYHQDDAKKGNEYFTETSKSNDKVIQRIENLYTSQKANNFYIVELSEMSTFDYSETDQSNPKNTKFQYEYDQYGNIIKTSILGDTSISGDERFEYTEYLYNTNLWIIDKPKRTHLHDYDDSTKVTETFYKYDNLNYGASPNKGDLTYTEKWLDDGPNVIEENDFDLYGNIIQYTDPRGISTYFEYDPTFTYKIGETNSKNHIYNYVYDFGTGNLISETDPNGNSIEYIYDSFGRKTKEIKPYDSNSYPTTLIEYSLTGTAPSLIKIKKREKSGIEETYDTYYYYDGFGRLVQRKSESESSSMKVTNDFYYDINDRLNKESNPYGSNIGFTSPNNGISGTTYEYDALNRLITQTNPDSTSREWQYNKWDMIFTDENNHDKLYSYDSYGNIIEINEYNLGETYITKYYYDVMDNLIEINDNQNNTISCIFLPRLSYE
jgi:YD repeat-containing protein